MMNTHKFYNPFDSKRIFWFASGFFKQTWYANFTGYMGNTTRRCSSRCQRYGLERSIARFPTNCQWSRSESIITMRRLKGQEPGVMVPTFYFSIADVFLHKYLSMGMLTLGVTKVEQSIIFSALFSEKLKLRTVYKC